MCSGLGVGVDFLYCIVMSCKGAWVSSSVGLAQVRGLSVKCRNLRSLVVREENGTQS